MSSVLVVGCGLLGTSIGLALRGSPWDDVTLADTSRTALDHAVGRGAGREWNGRETASMVVVSVPPSKTVGQLIELQSQDIAPTYTHVCSVQSPVQAEIEALSTDPSQIVGGHPLAGREVSGPESAVADLFVGRPWAVCATAEARAEAVAQVRHLAELCGAVPVDVLPDLHDATVALTSHAPQVLASALAGLLLTREQADQPLHLGLSGPGLADTTRLAASSPRLWAEVLRANAAEVAPLLRVLSAELDGVAGALDALAAGGDDPGAAEEVVARFLERGTRGRALVPVKRGSLAEAFTSVRVELADSPGELARLLVAAGDTGVNVEDLRLEHVPGRDRGVAELLVGPGAAERLAQDLRARGWHVFMSTH